MGRGRYGGDAVRRVPSGGRTCQRRLLLCGVCSVLWVTAGGGFLSADTVGKASTSRSTREAAIRDIPFDQLTPEARQRISAVVSNPSMFRRMPLNAVECDPELYRFLVRHPEVVVNIWQLMGITKVDVQRKGPYTFDASDGVGTATQAELVYGTNDTHLIYCEGSYEGSLFPQRLTGRCVLLLKSDYRSLNGDGWQVTNRLDVFLQVDHVGVDAFTRTLHPLFGKSADTNFMESTQFLERISRSSEENGPGMQRLAGRLDKVEPEVRSQFADLTTEVYRHAQQRLAAAQLRQESLPADSASSATIQRR